MDDDSLGLKHALSATNHNHSNDNEDDDDLLPVKHEEKLVSFGRLMVALVLVVSAALISFLTFRYVRDQETSDFRAQFYNDAKEFTTASDQNAKNVIAVLELLSKQLSSSANHQNETEWPFYTLHDFEVFGKQSRDLSGALLLAFSPLVEESKLLEWEDYSVENQWWVKEGYDTLDYGRVPDPIPNRIYPKITRASRPEDQDGLYAPIWQLSPAPQDTGIINFNLFQDDAFKRLVEFSFYTREPAFSEALNTEALFGSAAPQDGDNPQSVVVLPVLMTVDDPTSAIVGHVLAVIPWGLYFQRVLQGEHEAMVVLRESCGHAFSYITKGPAATFLGALDLHDPRYDNMVRSVEFVAFESNLTGISGLTDHCTYSLDIYPTVHMEDQSTSNKPWVFTIGVLGVFLFTSLVFVAYDRLVQRRQRRVMSSAKKTSAIVSSLFPASVREQLYSAERQKMASTKKHKRFGLSGFADHDASDNDGEVVKAPPIADFFPNSTVLFADIAGFTAWSSTREPSQVFVLLETIYSSFDRIAKFRGIFKVETIGDCYVAVAGLPELRMDHALVASRFARDILFTFDEMTTKLEVTLGPDTCDLKLRVGLHSGPVTAGVLRGERARFQLFGDTVNTASRMESTGIKNKIHISKETADLVAAGGKSHWVCPREDVVYVKGKGELSTYWLLPKVDNQTLSTSSGRSDGDAESEHSDACLVVKPSLTDQETAIPSISPRTQRMIDWNCDLLAQLLKRVVAARKERANGEIPDRAAMKRLEDQIGQTGNCLDELAEVIALPKYESFDSSMHAANPHAEKLSEDVVNQLHNFVTIISSLYRSNPFHNFEHASHVTMSASKLLARIVGPGHQESMNGEKPHDNAYGITSDPLTQFAVVFSALIHDVDHRGIPNFLLMKEDPALANVYNSRSVAEQNSVDVAWDLLMDSGFEDLRRAIYSDESEMKRFRQLIVNCVLATDIFDVELAAQRRIRWNKVFHPETSWKPNQSEDINSRKATIVIEHLLQASDVSHTMQHWHVFSKWNERLYCELYAAYSEGRSDKDPTANWYDGELSFFDNYVIPLARKLKECGVFGVSSDEYLNYAEKNRKEWEVKGREVVAALRQKYEKEYTGTYSDIESN